MRLNAFCAVAIPALIFAACSPAETDVQAGESAGSVSAVAPGDVEGAHFVGDAGSLSSSLQALEDSTAANANDADLFHRAGYAAYRRANLVTENKAELEALLKRARASLERANSLKSSPESWALLSSVIARQAEFDQPNAEKYYAASRQAMDSAARLGPDNPRVLLMQGISAFYSPEDANGGPKAAEGLFLRSVQLFERATATDGATWGHAEALAWLGQAQAKQGRNADAVATYRKALTVQPNYGWVKDGLLPEAEKAAAGT